MMQRIALLISLGLAMQSGELLAAEAGSVLFARGEVTAEREPPVPLAKGDAVMDDDTIATGEASRAQVLLTDGAKIAIRPNSRLRIEEYLFQGATDQDGNVVSTTGDRSVSTLIKGGFRTITGAIGKENEEAYEVRTPVGVLGIRGTDYSAVFCNGDCTWVPGFNPNAPIEDGLYLGVTDGTIMFSNEVGVIELDAGEYAFIPLNDRTPAQLDAPPPVLLDDNDLRFDADADDDDDGTLVGFDEDFGTRRAPDTQAPETGGPRPGQDPSTPEQPINAIDADFRPVDLTPGQSDPTGNRTISWSTGPLGRADSTWASSLENGPGEYVLDQGNQVLGFNGTYPTAVGPAPATIDIGTASNVESEFDSTFVLRWGRWSGGIATADVGGQVDPIDLTNQSLHWISGPETTSPPVMPITGTASYALIGNTSPTDNLGNVGVLGNATFFADFTNMRVDSTLTIDINATTWTATGTGNIGTAAQLPAHMFSGNYSVVAGGVAGGTGQFSGFFAPGRFGITRPDALGVGLTYSLQDGAGTTVSGAAAFGNVIAQPVFAQPVP